MTKTFPFLKTFRNGVPAEGGFELLDEEKLSCVTESPGVYVIEAMDGYKFPYPKGNSAVIYVGKTSRSLRKRLREHRMHLLLLQESNGEYGMSDNEPWVCQRYQYMYWHGAKVYYYSRRGKQDAKDLEAEILWQFYTKYRSLPVGNGAKSYAKPK